MDHTSLGSFSTLLKVLFLSPHKPHKTMHIPTRHKKLPLLPECQMWRNFSIISSKPLCLANWKPNTDVKDLILLNFVKINNQKPPLLILPHNLLYDQTSIHCQISKLEFKIEMQDSSVYKDHKWFGIWGVVQLNFKVEMFTAGVLDMRSWTCGQKWDFYTNAPLDHSGF